MPRFDDDALERLFRHTRIMFQRKRADLRSVVQIPHDSDKRSDRAHTARARAQLRDLPAHIEVLLLDANAHGVNLPLPEEKAQSRRPIESGSRVPQYHD